MKKILLACILDGWGLGEKNNLMQSKRQILKILIFLKKNIV